MMTKFRLTPKKNRKEGRPLLILLTGDEREYLGRVVVDRGGNMADHLRGNFFKKGWRRKLDELRAEQGPLAVAPKVS
jgi:hypothetical protein